MERVRRARTRFVVSQTVRRILESGVSWRVKRILVSVFARGLLSPPGTRIEHLRLGGVPAERVTLGLIDEGRAILFMHSGGYTTASARTHRPLCARLSRAAGAPVYSLDYRLAPEHPHPGALDDTLSAWNDLRDHGLAGEDLALAGDSAGGGLALAAAMRLRDADEEIPAALVLMCPWLDLTNSGESFLRNAERDACLPPGWGEPEAAAYAAGRDRRDIGLSPLFGDLAGLPPIHLQSAEEDLLLSDAVRLEERAREAGTPLEHRRQARLWHDFQSQPGMTAAADEAIDAAGEATRRCWGGIPFAGPAPTPRVAIVGAGFGGIGLALRLQREGIEEFTIFERGADIGGTWSVNTYPGAACDVPAHLYSLAIEPNHDWSRAYAGQEEILAYLRGVAARHGIDSHVRLGTEIARADFDEEACLWRLETTAGECHEAEVLVSACGQLSRPSVPPIPGIERFRGEMFHSAEWDHDAHLAGKRVAVVGTGASAIQFIPELAKEADRLQVFQRSPHYVVPKMDFEYPLALRRLFALVPPLRLAYRAFMWQVMELTGRGFGASQAPLWPLKFGFQRQIADQLPAGPVRDALTPTDAIGCKRVLFSSEYFAAYARENVELTTELISEIGEDGVISADGAEHPADAIVWGTGFKTNEFLTPMRLFGAGGRELNEAWRDGAHAYLGITVAGFPNLFLMYGPNTNLGSGSIIYMLESQAAYIADAVKTLRRAGGGRIDLRPEAGEAFESEMQERLEGTVWGSGCNNWYLDESGRNSNNWPGVMREYRLRTRRLDPADYVVRSHERAREPVA